MARERRLRAARSCYRLLLTLLPREFRARYGAELELTFAEALDSAAREGRSLLGAFALAVGDLVSGAIAMRRARKNVALIPALHPPHDRAIASMDSLLQDLRYGVRGLLRNPGFTLLAIGALALGVGANVTIFTLVNEVLLRPLPVQRPDRLVDIYVEQPGANSFSGFSYPEFEQYRDTARAVTVAASSGIGLALDSAPDAPDVPTGLVSGNYLSTLGVEAARGRLFSADDGTEGDAAVVVVSHGFWQRRLGGSNDAIGSRIRLNDIPFTVLGILPEGFSGRWIGFPIEAWIPLGMMESLRPGIELRRREVERLEFLGRMADGETPESADAALDAVAARLESRYPEANRERRVSVSRSTGIDRSLRAGVMGFAGVLTGLAALVLLISCLNVGSLLLARAARRRGEIATRQALGASRGRLIRQLLTESVVLFVLGSGAAWAVSLAISAAVRRFIDSLPIPLGFELGVDGRVLAYTATVALVTAVATGLSPALAVTAGGRAGILRSARGHSTGSTRMRQLFVIGQVAVSVVLLVGAGLFLRAFINGQRLDPGFDMRGLHTASIGLPAQRYGAGEIDVFFRELTAGLRGAPAVEAVALAQRAPIGVGRTPLRIGPAGGDRDDFVVDTNRVSAGYFSTVGIAIREGRGFVDADAESMNRVGVVNRLLAERFWPDGRALGRRLAHIDGEIEIVGVVDNTRTVVQDDEASPTLYLHFAAQPSSRALLVLRSSVALATLREVVATEVALLDATLTPPRPRPLTALIGFAMLPQRVASRITMALGVLGLLLAVGGVYGIVAYLLAQRRHELGIRLAMGSSPSALVALVMRSGAILVGVGILLGTLGALLAGPLLRGFLVGITPADPMTFVIVVGAIAVAALAAAFLPARLAARIDPATILREE